MNLAAIIVGILAALLAPVMVVVAMAAGTLLNLVQLVHARARTARKPATRSDGYSRKNDAEVVKMPEGKDGGEGFRPAA